MPAAGSVNLTDPVGPTMPEMVSEGSPLPPPISSTLWPAPIRASSIRADVTGAKIWVISARYLSQYGAELCHDWTALFCSSGFILVTSARSITSNSTSDYNYKDDREHGKAFLPFRFGVGRL